MSKDTPEEDAPNIHFYFSLTSEARKKAMKRPILRLWYAEDENVGHEIGDNEVNSSTSSTENQHLARKWVKKCANTHAHCAAGRLASRSYPSRLLEIKTINGDTVLRVVEYSDAPLEGDYVTLSHCWGTVQFLKLLKSNLSSLKEGFPLSSLPKSFQDAVTVTGWFGVQYLWIDSLCIIQDSHEDWFKESSKMKSVYRNSYLTIAATAAVDSSAGLFYTRDPEAIQPIKFHRTLELFGKKGDIFCIDEDLWHDGVSEAPLNKRSWVFQERLLSPRVLHFAGNQMFWECQELDACETFPEGLPPDTKKLGKTPKYETHPYHTQPGGKRLGRAKRLLLENGDFHETLWIPIVKMYSGRALTMISDKTIAFAGIVEECQAISNSNYIAGLWRANLQCQLLWKVPKENFAERPPLYLAPSWSWLSVNGAIIPSPSSASNYDVKRNVVLDITQVHVKPASDNICGPIKSGCIDCRGILRPSKWFGSRPTHRKGRMPSPQEMFRPETRTWPLEFHGIKELFGPEPKHSWQATHRWVPSTATDTWMDGDVQNYDETICMPILSEIYHSKDCGFHHVLRGLLLVRIDSIKDEFRRVGMFEAESNKIQPSKLEGSEKLWADKLADGTIWQEIPRETFTLI